LQALLGLPEPIYRHHRLMTDEQGRRFAKRDRSQTLRQIRAAGTPAAALRQELGFQ
jgi:glutamyl-Q tRNA(Asp) synthetase